MQNNATRSIAHDSMKCQHRNETANAPVYCSMYCREQSSGQVASLLHVCRLCYINMRLCDMLGQREHILQRVTIEFIQIALQSRAELFLHAVDAL